MIDKARIEYALNLNTFVPIEEITPEEYRKCTPRTILVAVDAQGRRKLIIVKGKLYDSVLERTLPLEKRKLTESYSEDRFLFIGFKEKMHYINEIQPGATAGKHGHGKKAEKFRVVASETESLIVDLLDPETGEETQVPLNSKKIQLGEDLYYPSLLIWPGIWHAVSNPASNTDTIVLLAEANTLHDPADDIPLPDKYKK